MTENNKTEKTAVMLRLTADELKEIKMLQKIFNEKTVTKTIMKGLKFLIKRHNF